MTFPTDGDKSTLELDDELIVTPPEDGDDQDNSDDDGGEGFVGFADESDEDESEQTPLVKKLRDQIRDRDRRLAKLARTAGNDDDEREPQLPEEPGEIDQFGYDDQKYRAAWKSYNEAVKAHAEWSARQKSKSEQREAEQVQTVKRIQQQAKQLGVVDFDAREARVRDAMNTIQLKAIVQYAENPAAFIAALGGSQTKLDELSSVEDPAMFMKMLGRMERDIKMSKRRAPEPEARVRGGNASVTEGTDKELERLERAAERSGNRSAVIAYKREMRQRA